jgi:nitrite reductase/ring-hydroxylating ferredoxin subunit
MEYGANWVEVLEETELPANTKRMVRAGGKSILLINYHEELFAVDNACPHWGFPLNAGKVSEDYTLTCAFHRSGFDIRTGDCKEWSPWPPRIGPLLKNIRRKNLLPTYKTLTRGGKIYVDPTSSQEEQSVPV